MAKLPDVPDHIRHQSQSPFDPLVKAQATAARPSPRPEPRHVLRPADEYEEYDEEYKLRIPRSNWPDGFELQWVTYSVFNQEQPQHRARFERQGWVSVHQNEFDGRYRGLFMPQDYEGEIKLDGLVLMARSKAWCDRARQLDQRKARERVQIKEMQLRSGALDGVTLAADHPEAVRRNVINRTVEPISVVPVPQQ